MAYRVRHRWLVIVTALLLAGLAGLITWMLSPAEYVPVVWNDRQGLVEYPLLLTPAHLDRLEIVLKNYGEWHERVDPTRLRISRSLSLDRDLLWNYTTKAEDLGSTGG